MLIVGGEFPKKKANDSYREPKQDKRRTLNTLNMEYTQIDENKGKNTYTFKKYLQIEEINQILSDQYQKQGQKEERLISKSQLLTIK